MKTVETTKKTSGGVRVGLASVLALGLLGVARADSISYTASIPNEDTVWNHVVNIPRFDSSLGTLLTITFQLTGNATGDAMFENKSTTASMLVTSEQTATISLMRPDLTTLVQVVPLATTIDTMPTYDGVLDYAGTSGKTYFGLSASLVNTVTLSSITASDMALFVGAGNIALPATATGGGTLSNVGGKLNGEVTTQAGAGVRVTYTYQVVAVPDAGSTWVLLLTGLAMLPIGALRRKV